MTDPLAGPFMSRKDLDTPRPEGTPSRTAQRLAGLLRAGYDTTRETATTSQGASE
jgi:hypothetical protein